MAMSGDNEKKENTPTIERQLQVIDVQICQLEVQIHQVREKLSELLKVLVDGRIIKLVPNDESNKKG